MALDLGNKVSKKDVESTRSDRNKPEFEEGFAPSSGDDDDFGSLFDDISFDNLDGSSSSSDPFGGSSIGGSSLGGSGSDLFGSSLGGGFGSTFGGGFNQQPQQVPPQPDAVDKAMEMGGNAFMAFGRIIGTTFKSFKKRNANDIGIFSKNIIITGGILIASGLAISLVGLVTGINGLKIFGLPSTMIGSGITLLGGGVIGLIVPGYLIDSGRVSNTPSTFNNTSNNLETSNSLSDFTYDSSESEDDDFDDFFADEEDDDSYFDFDSVGVKEDEPNEELESLIGSLDDSIQEKKDPKELLESIQSNVPIITRQYLVDMMIRFFPLNTKGFADKRKIDNDSEEFELLETLTLKSIATAAKLEYEDFDKEKHYVAEAYETLFTYEIRATRYRKLSNTDEIAKEIAVYFKKDVKDTGVSANVYLDGDYYVIIVNKGNRELVTLGDIFTLSSTVDFFKNEKHRLPMVLGVMPDGQPLIKDAKDFDTMMIAGQPRSGKSWTTFSMLVNLMAFNTPEDVQILMVDPKNSAMMKTVSLMPHVCGFHTHETILELLRTVVEKEGKRREKLLQDHGCDTIWDLRDITGIKLPILYIFMDEFITITGSLEREERKELDTLIKTIVTNFPSKGIRLIIISHRTQGEVDKTVRGNMGFRACIMATAETIKETLDISKPPVELPNIGDTLASMKGERLPIYYKGNGVGTTDGENAEIIKNIARAFYKMGVDIPDMSTLGYYNNRDEQHIIDQLKLSNDENKSTKVQVDFVDSWEGSK